MHPRRRGRCATLGEKNGSSGIAFLRGKMLCKADLQRIRPKRRGELRRNRCKMPCKAAARGLQCKASGHGVRISLPVRPSPGETVMSSEGSVTRWVRALKGGDVAAAQPLWERYYRRLVSLARGKLRSARRREADEEDVVQSAFRSFFQGVARDRFPQLG